MSLRAEAAIESVVGAARLALRELDPNLPVTDERFVRDVLEEGLWAPRVGAVLLGLFGLLALCLSALGVYGVLAHTMGRRTREIAIRLTFGADRLRIYRLLIGRGMAPVLVGLGLGVAAAAIFARQAANLLFRVSPTDGATFVASGLVLLGVALVGCYLPVRRAVDADPAAALRSE